MKPENEEETHALTLGATIQWLRGFAAARGVYTINDDIPPLYALESAQRYFQSRASGEYDNGPRPASPEDEGIKELARFAEKDDPRAFRIVARIAEPDIQPTRKWTRKGVKDGRSDPARAAERSARSKRVWAKKRATAKKGKR